MFEDMILNIQIPIFISLRQHRMTRSMGIVAKILQVCIPALPLNSCVRMDKLLIFLSLSFLIFNCLCMIVGCAVK